MLDALSTLPDCRPAEPGEFTRRAFHSGKLDLTAVEGLADLIHAETESQRKQALQQASGSLGKLYSRWRTEILKSIGHFEAFIDFSEDENIETDVLERVQGTVVKLMGELKEHLSKRHGERIRTGVRTVIVGEPNVGKSSLLNLLCQRSVAIVTEVPGTTRDVLETQLDIGGYPMTLMDTAGLREEALVDQVEAEGMKRAKERAREADLIIVLCSGQSLAEAMQKHNWTAAEYVADYVQRLGVDGLDGKRIVVALNKMDLLSKEAASLVSKTRHLIKSPPTEFVVDVGLSCRTGEGLGDMMQRIEQELQLM